MKSIKDKNYSIAHTKQRLKERYNISINDNDYNELCSYVQNKTNTTFISEEKQKKDIQQIYDVSFGGTVIRIVWSTSSRYIKTALPLYEKQK